MNLEITKKMAKTIEEKEKLNKELTDLLKKCTNLEIGERTKRTYLMNKLAESGVKMTEKAKIAQCDAELKTEMDNITYIKLAIGEVKREIELCNDKISLYRNMIRELEVTK